MVTLYLMGSYEYEWFKIGVSEDIPRRYAELSNGLPFGLQLLAVYETERAGLVELRLHKHYDQLRINGEWFNYINPADFLKQAMRFDHD